MNLNIEKPSIMTSPKFIYGVATASFQIEGGADDRLPCIWDQFCSQPGKIADNSNGDVACDHFNRWKDDVELIDSLGVDAYRLSLSWPRLINQDGQLRASGLAFYLDLLDELNSRNIKPFVTFYHWDLPLHLEEKGGWLNRETAYQFRSYVDQVSKALGDRVYSYATLNEPFCSAYLGYEAGIHAPGHKSKTFGKKAAHHLLLAHGLAIQVLNQNCPQIKKGIVLNFTPAYPNTDSRADKIAANKADDHFNQWYIKPIFDGQYPELIKQLPQEYQPDILDGDLEIISTKVDYLGINFYTRAVYSAADNEYGFEELPAQPPLTDIGWQIYPTAFTDLLLSLNKLYDLPPIYITENGMADADKLENGAVEDPVRVDYLQKHLNAVNDAILQGVDVRGYFAWSLMDNFEWAEGYTKRFGVVYVDYRTQQRTIKQSGLAYREFLKLRKG
ncbi:MAG: GH1 family beta-glucosidase [Kangiellaceae bacterium]